MKLLGQHEDQIDIRLGMDELILLHDALHEMCFGLKLSDEDFQAILGVSHSEAENLLVRVGNVLERLGIGPESS